MLYILLERIDDRDRPDCGTGWGIYEAETPEEVLERASAPDAGEPFFLVEAGKAFGPKADVREIEIRDYGTGD